LDIPKLHKKGKSPIIMKKILLVLLFLPATIFAQKAHSFYDDVQTIKAYDKMYQPPANPILFVGSSSIRKWDNLQQVFGKYNVLNRGVGGTVINDITYYINDLIFAYQPRQIVLYVGENDLPDEKSTADSVLARTIVLYKAIRVKLPNVPIAYIALKPSPVRDKYVQKAIAANALIKSFLAGEKNTAFIDVFKPMVTAEGKSRPELFVQDMLHMNAKGYAIWEKAVEPYLIRE
jgi:lysophospholipase L1-like esterase